MTDHLPGDDEPTPHAIARCMMCGAERATEPGKDLPFHWTNKYPDADGYYCGCRGWD